MNSDHKHKHTNYAERELESENFIFTRIVVLGSVKNMSNN